MQTVTLRENMDIHSREILVDGKFIGFYQWHPTRKPRVVFHQDTPIFDVEVDTMKTILELGNAAHLRMVKSVAIGGSNAS